MTEHSTKSLREKLGIKPGMRLYLHNVPVDVMTELGDLDDDTTIVHDEVLANYFHYFVTSKTELTSIAETLQHLNAPGQILWISWHKNLSKDSVKITEQDLRDALLPIGMVDTKVASISATYSGLKFVWRAHKTGTNQL